MDEKRIEQAVAAVIGEMSGRGGLTVKPSDHDHKDSGQKMTLKLATAIIEKVEAEASRMGVAAVIAVSDEKGRPVAVHCMDDAFMASFDIALNKTFTSAGLKMSTAQLAPLAQPGAPLYGIDRTNDGKIVIFGGGEPLFVGERLMGALGVSGGTAPQDTALAAYGRSIFMEMC